MLAKKTVKNQITLPKQIIDQLPATDYFEVQLEGETVVLRPVEMDRSSRVQEKLAELGITDGDLRDAVAWAQGRNAAHM